MRRDSWPVEPDTYHTRTGFCHYCKQPVGTEHGAECPYRIRTVITRITFEYLLPVMEAGDAAFYIEESSRCNSNALVELEKLETRIRARHEAAGLNCWGIAGCLCAFSKAEYVREATEEDHERFAFDWEGGDE